MAISLNALFNVPTRDEKERKAARGQAQVDRMSELAYANELAQNQLKFAKELGVEYDDKEYDRLTKRNLEALRAAGDAQPESTLGKARSSPMYEAANKAVEYISGGKIGLPKKKVETEAAGLEEKAATSLLNKAGAKARLPYQNIIADTEAEKTVSGNVIARQANDRTFELGPLSGQAEAAGLAAKRDEARNYVEQGQLRQLENNIGLLQAQMKQKFLGQLSDDPLQFNLMMNPRLSPADFGRGIAPQNLMDNPMTPLGQPQTPTVQPMSTLGQPPANANRLTLEQQYARLRQIMQQNPVKVKPQE